MPMENPSYFLLKLKNVGLLRLLAVDEVEKQASLQFCLIFLITFTENWPHIKQVSLRQCLMLYTFPSGLSDIHLISSVIRWNLSCWIIPLRILYCQIVWTFSASPRIQFLQRWLFSFCIFLHSQKKLAHWTTHVTVQNYACCFSG